MLILLVVLYYANTSETFYIPPNIVGEGDYHIQTPGEIADQGSFTTDMRNYMQGDGPI